MVESIGQGLRTNLKPWDLRAESLQVLGLLSDVDVAATNRSITTLALLAQLGDGGKLEDLPVSDLDIDASTGQIVGIRVTYPHRSTSLMPAGVIPMDIMARRKHRRRRRPHTLTWTLSADSAPANYTIDGTAHRTGMTDCRFVEAKRRGPPPQDRCHEQQLRWQRTRVRVR